MTGEGEVERAGTGDGAWTGRGESAGAGTGGGERVGPGEAAWAGAPDRLGEVAAAAARAFRLLPAAPQDVAPSEGHGPPRPARRISADPDTVERDLVRLVLTLVELLRQLMERQALHRADQGDLTEDEEERLGATLMILHDRMNDLCARYGLTLADLNLDLGPLGTLLPTDEPEPPPWSGDP
ncbi:gas vesicle protein K [Streptomyces sp. NPDC046985]|uniref:gas vesicle protein K n=1 Tax=Streptomyces sp. NPDC046985 TaxID=3155377 RepID=UPI0033F48960